MKWMSTLVLLLREEEAHTHTPRVWHAVTVTTLLPLLSPNSTETLLENRLVPPQRLLQFTQQTFQEGKKVVFYPQLSKLWRTVSNAPAEIQHVKVCITTVEQQCCTHRDRLVWCHEQHCKTQGIPHGAVTMRTRIELKGLFLVHCDGSMVY